MISNLVFVVQATSYFLQAKVIYFLYYKILPQLALEARTQLGTPEASRMLHAGA